MSDPATYRPGEVAVSVCWGLAVMVGSAFALSAAGLDRPAAATEIDHGAGVPVRVIPVLDLDAPLLKLGGKRDRMKLPDRWVRQVQKPRVEERAFASSKAGKTEHDIPPHDMKMADAGTPPPLASADLAREVDTPLVDPVDAAPPANVDQAGHADGVQGGTETDPLKARAVDLYRAKIASWFSSRFAVHGSGLPREEIVKYRGSAVVQIGADGVVAGYSLTPNGNATFDAAARATLEGSKGQSIPPPPENYPDVAQSQLDVTFECRENRCD